MKELKVGRIDPALMAQLVGEDKPILSVFMLDSGAMATRYSFDAALSKETKQDVAFNAGIAACVVTAQTLGKSLRMPAALIMCTLLEEAVRALKEYEKMERDNENPGT